MGHRESQQDQTRGVTANQGNSIADPVARTNSGGSPPLYKKCRVCGIVKHTSEFYELTRQCKICKKAIRKKWRKKNKKRENDRINKHKAKFHKRTTIQARIRNLVRKGKIEKGPCVICGSTINVHGHHCDYNKPLDVMWLCATHHMRWHAKNKPIPHESEKEINGQ